MLQKAIADFFSQFDTHQVFWLGFSGGLDSHVLLTLCANYHREKPIQLNVIHVNHGLHLKANDWVNHCELICQSFGFKFITETVHIHVKKGDSLEEVARQKRYAAFAKMMGAQDVLLTAHQQDDQAETLLLQLLRGSGLKGLAAMPSLASFAAGYHARPLLTFSRAELELFAKENSLQWIDDSSNSDTRLTRNFIRQEILPKLKQRWPTAAKLIARSAGHCAEAQGLLEDISVAEWLKSAGSKANTLSVAKLLRLDEARQRLVLRTWFQRAGHSMPDMKKLATICQSVLLAKNDRMPCVQWQNTELRRYRDDLYLLPVQQSFSSTQNYEWKIPQPLTIAEWGQLQAIPAKGQGLKCSDDLQITVCFRGAVSSCKIVKRGKLSLKNLFQEWGVPPWERDRLPLLFINDYLVAVPGYYLAEEFAAKNNENGYLILVA